MANNGLKFLIIFLNVVLRIIIIKVIEQVRSSTRSKEMIYITDLVFICQLFNTGFLLMICNANLNEQSNPVFNGLLPDFN